MGGGDHHRSIDQLRNVRKFTNLREDCPSASVAKRELLCHSAINATQRNATQRIGRAVGMSVCMERIAKHSFELRKKKNTEALSSSLD